MTSRNQTFVKAVLVLAALTAVVPSALAQNYPSKPIRVMLPFATGATDIVTRWVATKLSPVVGQSVVPEPRTGAGGNIAHEAAARAAPDGYTLLVTGPPMVFNPLLNPKVGYDPIKDFVAIALLAKIPNVAVVHPSVPAKSLQELAALARARPGKMSYASGGVGSSPHLAAELFKSIAKVNILHVPYKGGTLGLVDMMRGEIDMAMLAAPGVRQHVSDGKIRALAVLNTSRVEALPGVPTSKEAGMPELIAVNWYILFAPAGTPGDIVQRLNAEVTKIMQTAETRERLAGVGGEPATGTLEQTAKFLATEHARWGKVIREAGISAK
jgi:tripartite-type tricarboxylate transporter receptor subunit TctC